MSSLICKAYLIYKKDDNFNFIMISSKSYDKPN
jgi:hypothetical protein